MKNVLIGQFSSSSKEELANKNNVKKVLLYLKAAVSKDLMKNLLIKTNLLKIVLL